MGFGAGVVSYVNLSHKCAQFLFGKNIVSNLCCKAGFPALFFDGQGVHLNSHFVRHIFIVKGLVYLAVFLNKSAKAVSFYSLISCVGGTKLHD